MGALESLGKLQTFVHYLENADPRADANNITYDVMKLFKEAVVHAPEMVETYAYQFFKGVIEMPSDCRFCFFLVLESVADNCLATRAVNQDKNQAMERLLSVFVTHLTVMTGVAVGLVKPSAGVAAQKHVQMAGAGSAVLTRLKRWGAALPRKALNDALHMCEAALGQDVWEKRQRAQIVYERDMEARMILSSDEGTLDEFTMSYFDKLCKNPNAVKSMLFTPQIE
ncbi:hypothetical protein KIPB_001632 [Kipferlia bialata]|uniref:Uncharacterized protein n=1 Tax=Kipferlia bialata TaxID=797122 RepID=A0A9K3CS97_9EUKA|nr:hypothetical protein KIPB_001632 [Kipferlia bialata]|eukprot:g1632.t1